MYFHPWVHTLGVASTQRVEGANAVLKRVAHKIGSLVDLDEAKVGMVQDATDKTER